MKEGSMRIFSWPREEAGGKDPAAGEAPSFPVIALPYIRDHLQASLVITLGEMRH